MGLTVVKNWSLEEIATRKLSINERSRFSKIISLVVKDEKYDFFVHSFLLYKNKKQDIGYGLLYLTVSFFLRLREIMISEFK